jgi:heme A synthase
MPDAEERAENQEGKVDQSEVPTLTVTGTVITGSSSGRGQTWSVERGEWEIKRGSAEHRQRQEEERQQHELTEAKKDNEQRRRVFWLIVGLLIVILLISGAVGIANEDGETRRWAQNIVTTLIGGLLGAVAGYFTAKGGK